MAALHVKFSLSSRDEHKSPVWDPQSGQGPHCAGFHACMAKIVRVCEQQPHDKRSHCRSPPGCLWVRTDMNTAL